MLPRDGIKGFSFINDVWGFEKDDISDISKCFLKKILAGQGYYVLMVGFHGKPTLMAYTEISFLLIGEENVGSSKHPTCWMLDVWRMLDAWRINSCGRVKGPEWDYDTVPVKVSAHSGRLWSWDGTEEWVSLGAKGPGVYSPVLTSNCLQAAQVRRQDPREGTFFC